MERKGRYALSIISAVAFVILGIVASSVILGNVAIIISLSVAAACPIIIYVVNLILGKCYINKINKSKVDDMHNYMLRHRQEAENTAQIKLALLKRIRCVGSIIAVFVWVCAVCASLIFGALLKSFEWFSLFCLAYCALVFYAAYGRVYRKKRIILGEGDIPLLSHKYPKLYKLARRAADTLGCEDEICILLTFDSSASIAKDKNRYLVILGTVLLDILSEEELYCVFLHEFSHVHSECRESTKATDYNEWLRTKDADGDKLGFIENLFLYTDVCYSFNYMVYNYATSVVNELEADRTALKYGNPKAAVSALVKTKYYDMYLWEEEWSNRRSILESEELAADYLKNLLEDFKKKLEDRREFWRDLLEKEILSHSATHPTLKMRMELLGVSEIEEMENNSSEAYLAEIKGLLDYAEKWIYEDRLKSYSQEREQWYLKPLKRIEEWKKKGMPVTAETYVDIISDLRGVRKNDEVEDLCDRVIAELNENSAAYAHFTKGNIMLHRYDVGGIEHIYRAIELNRNAINEGLFLVGSFCCYTGNEAELLRYRELAPKLAQQEKDEGAYIGVLTKKDKLTKENLPEGMLDNILSFILSLNKDLIQNVYLVRKTINDKVFTSAFVIRFTDEAGDQRGEIMHKIFCYLDAYPEDWQFSLFDYDDVKNVNVEKIEGSLVYRRSI